MNYIRTALATVSVLVILPALASVANAQQFDTSPSYPQYQPQQALPTLDLPKRSDVGVVDQFAAPASVSPVKSAAPVPSVATSDTTPAGTVPAPSPSDARPGSGATAVATPGAPAAELPKSGSTAEMGIPRGTVIVGRAEVLDGQNLVVDGKALRLDGAEAPGLGQTCMTTKGTPWECGKRAYARLADLAHGRMVRCVTVQPLGEGASAICGGNGVSDFAERLVTEGLAVSNGHDRGRYAADQSTARTHRKGMWVGSFTLPWKWRIKNGG